MDGLAGGLYPQTVCQVKGLNSVIECRGAVVGGTGGVGQGMQVNGGNWAILVVNVGGKLSILGLFATSTGLLATTSAVTLMSLGRSISACTTVGPALLLLLGELWVCLLVLHSAKLVGLRGLATATTRGTLLFEREGCCLDNTIWLQVLDFSGSGLTQNLSYNLHGRRELE